jgi:hypothetical protein
MEIDEHVLVHFCFTQQFRHAGSIAMWSTSNGRLSTGHRIPTSNSLFLRNGFWAKQKMVMVQEFLPNSGKL